MSVTQLDLTGLGGSSLLTLGYRESFDGLLRLCSANESVSSYTYPPPPSGGASLGFSSGLGNLAYPASLSSDLCSASETVPRRVSVAFYACAPRLGGVFSSGSLTGAACP